MGVAPGKLFNEARPQERRYPPKEGNPYSLMWSTPRQANSPQGNAAHNNHLHTTKLQTNVRTREQLATEVLPRAMRCTEPPCRTRLFGPLDLFSCYSDVYSCSHSAVIKGCTETPSAPGATEQLQEGAQNPPVTPGATEQL